MQAKILIFDLTSTNVVVILIMQSFVVPKGDELMRIDRVAFAAALARADLNVKGLSELSGVSRQTVTAIKTGKSCSKATAEKLAEILGESILKEKGA